MGELIDHPGLTPAVKGYPNYTQAKSYLVDFFKQGWSVKNHALHHFCYQHAPGLRVLVIRLVTGIFEVRAYPHASGENFLFEEALEVEEFRAWLFAYDYPTRQINYIAGSLGKGIKLYKRIRLDIEKKGKLAKADQGYLSIPHRGATAKAVITSDQLVIPW
ncbi:unnamed protein product [marine sediment metagenome]|uniref:Uncharacterized protein n=1 Tax=marine sediment metagenome TaxID=412755 RepID=X1UT76_9ZZZZ